MEIQLFFWFFLNSSHHNRQYFRGKREALKCYFVCCGSYGSVWPSGKIRHQTCCHRAGHNSDASQRYRLGYLAAKWSIDGGLS